MKKISQYISEALKAPNWKKIRKSLSKEDLDFVHRIASDGNSYRSAEDIEKELWQGSLKDRVDELYDKALSFINGIIPEKNIIDYYSLATSGKNRKIDVTAEIFWAIENFV